MNSSTSLDSYWGLHVVTEQTSLALGEVCSLANGRAFKPSEWSSSGLPIVRIQNLNDPAAEFNYFDGDVSERHRVRDGDILLSWSGTPGTSFGCFVWTRGDAVLNQHIFRVSVNTDLVRPSFFVHAVNSRLQEMIAQAHGGVGLRHITKERLVNIRLPIPPLDKQQALADLIDCLLHKATEIRALRVHSRKDAEALLGAEIDAHLRDVPGRSVQLGDVCEIKQPLVDPRDPTHVDKLHVGGANIVAGTGQLVELKSAREEGLISGKFPFDATEVLYSKIRPYLRKVARPEFSGLCSADMYPLAPRPSVVLRDYLFFLLLSDTFTNYAVRASNRAGMPKVNRDQLFAFAFSLPTLAEQSRIAATLDDVLIRSVELNGQMQRGCEEIQGLDQAIVNQLIPATPLQ